MYGVRTTPNENLPNKYLTRNQQGNMSQFFGLMAEILSWYSACNITNLRTQTQLTQPGKYYHPYVVTHHFIRFSLDSRRNRRKYYFQQTFFLLRIAFECTMGKYFLKFVFEVYISIICDIILNFGFFYR